MAKRFLVSRLGLVVLAGVIFLMPAEEASAREGREARHDRHREVVVAKNRRYHYRDGRFYWPSFFNFGLFVARPPFGAVVTVLPARHKTLVLSGITYYYYDDVYYRVCPGGYRVVPEPVSGPKITINVPHSRGGFISVTLTRQGDGYRGPQGEYYPGHPTVEQLRALYGN